ncbi:type II secretion system protein GspM [Aurantivibrio plasticivorans]
MNWFLQQSRRDQIALLILSICVGLYCIWMLGVKPLANAKVQANNRYVAASESVARIKSLAAALKYHESMASEGNAPQDMNIASLIDTTTKANGLSFVTLNPSRNGEEATVRFDNVGLANLVSWLHQLENQYEAVVEDLNMVAGNEAGKVMATVRIKK